MKAEVRELAKPKPQDAVERAEQQPFEEIVLNFPTELASPEDVDLLIAEMEKLKTRLAAGGARLRIRWQ